MYWIRLLPSAHAAFISFTRGTSQRSLHRFSEDWQNTLESTWRRRCFAAEANSGRRISTRAAELQALVQQLRLPRVLSCDRAASLGHHSWPRCGSRHNLPVRASQGRDLSGRLGRNLGYATYCHPLRRCSLIGSGLHLLSCAPRSGYCAHCCRNNICIISRATPYSVYISIFVGSSIS